jgi:Zn-dependent protease
MDTSADFIHDPNPEKNSEPLNSTHENSFIYPPKPEIENKKGNFWVRSVTSLALYLLIGYFFFSANWGILLILTGVVIVHELGHFIAMKFYRYTDLGIFFIPLIGAYASGTKREISQKQSVIILLAGPLPGIIAGSILYYLCEHQLYSVLPLNTVALLLITSKLLIFLNMLNLLPIYPLDGGQLLNRLFLDETKIVGKIFLILSAATLAYFAVKLEFYPLLIFPVMMLLRLQSDSRLDNLSKQVEEKGIDLEKSYEELTDEEYWTIRNILIENNYPSLRNVAPAPPYEYATNEDKVVSSVENLLQRSIVQDLNWAGKIIILLIWIGCFLAPFFVHVQLPFIHL